MQRRKNLGEVTIMCSQVQPRFKSITGVWVINASVFNLGRVFASLTRNILFWYKIKLSGSHSDGKKEVTSYYVSNSKVAGNNKSKFWKIGELTNPAWWREMTVISRYVCTSSFWVRHSTVHAIPGETGAYISTFCTRCFWLTLHLLTLFFCFHYETRKKAKFIFYAKENGSWTWKALGWAGKRWRRSGRSQFDDVSCSKFQFHSLTQGIFEMMLCGICDPIWLISRLNTDVL